MKSFFKNNYLAQIRHGQLKVLLKLYLRHCGKRDARKKIIRESANGIYASPLIYHEIHLYSLAIHAEKERLVRSLMAIQAEIDIFQLQIEEKTQLINTTDSTTKLHSTQIITILNSKMQELLSLKESESASSQLRCKQMYHILEAKIAAYWSGVLQVQSNDLKLPPYTMISQLMQGGNLSYEPK